jgi:hypothetical protein
LCLAFLLILSLVNAQTESITFVVASAGQGHAHACLHNNLQPIEVSGAWNATRMKAVVEDQLGRTVSAGSATHLGIKGCCSPSLWCNSTECFTQSFGSQFVNYGWLPENTAFAPIFSCWQPPQNFSVNLLVGIASVSSSADSAQVQMLGTGFGTDPKEIIVDVAGKTCSNVELWNCRQCSSSKPCPVGMACYGVPGGDGDTAYCFPVCAGAGDLSCPVNQHCANTQDIYSTSTPLCLPQGDYAKVFVTNCKSGYSDLLTCNANTSFSSAVNALVPSTQFDLSTTLAGDNYNSSYTTHPCLSNTDCYDGNICTSDSCQSGNCIYQSSGDCESITQSIREQYTPYQYEQIFVQDISMQKTFMSGMQAHGDNIELRSGSSAATTQMELPFKFLYFGNVISELTIVWDQGLILLPPITCSDLSSTDQECLYFSSATNVLSPWFQNSNSHWVKVIGWTYLQVKDESATTGWQARGVNTNAVHVLWNVSGLINDNYAKDDDNHDDYYTDHTPWMSFSTSIYEDGSIRMSYLAGDFDNTDLSTSFFGLWGSFASESPSYLRYHQENISLPLISTGNDFVFCSFNNTACIPESCVSRGEVLKVSWNATSVSCLGLQPEYTLSYSCEWGGGGGLVSNTAARISVPTTDATVTGELSCEVPVLPFPDGTVVSVAIVTSLVSVNPTGSDISANIVPNKESGSKIIYAVAEGKNSELARSNLMIRYYNSSSASSSCGCSPLASYSGQTCSSQGICGQSASNSVQDCAGTPFGSAYKDGCNHCAGGYTGVVPNLNGNCEKSKNNELFNLLTQTIILLMIICCMTFITSAVSYSIRKMLYTRYREDERLMQMLENPEFGFLQIGGNNNGNNATTSNRRGLSDFELGALGQTTFTKEFYSNYLQERKKKDAEKEKEREKQQKEEETTLTEEDKISSQKKIIDFNQKEGHETDSSKLENPNVCECSICLMDVEEGSLCRVLPEPCGHIFHLSCIDEWFRQSAFCPLCKRSMRGILEGHYDEDGNARSPEEISLQLNTFHHPPPSRVPSRHHRNHPFYAQNQAARYYNRPHHIQLMGRRLQPHHLLIIDHTDEDEGIVLTTAPSRRQINSFRNNSAHSLINGGGDGDQLDLEQQLFGTNSGFITNNPRLSRSFRNNNSNNNSNYQRVSFLGLESPLEEEQVEEEHEQDLTRGEERNENNNNNNNNGNSPTPPRSPHRIIVARSNDSDSSLDL